LSLFLYSCFLGELQCKTDLLLKMLAFIYCKKRPATWGPNSEFR